MVCEHFAMLCKKTAPLYDTVVLSGCPKSEEREVKCLDFFDRSIFRVAGAASVCIS